MDFIALKIVDLLRKRDFIVVRKVSSNSLGRGSNPLRNVFQRHSYVSFYKNKIDNIFFFYYLVKMNKFELKKIKEFCFIKKGFFISLS